MNFSVRSCGFRGTAVLASVTGTSLFACLTYGVVERAGLAQLDHEAATFAVVHRTGSLSTGMEVITRLGSSAILVPLLMIATAYLLRARGAVWATFQIWAAYLGAVVLYTSAKSLVVRPRPAADEMITQASGFAYPSGHATQSVAVWGMLALVLARRHSGHARALMFVPTALIVFLVGFSRIYLGAHWLTDVLAGYLLGATWVAVLCAVRLRPIRERTAD